MAVNPPTILRKILARKAEEVAERRARQSLGCNGVYLSRTGERTAYTDGRSEKSTMSQTAQNHENVEAL